MSKEFITNLALFDFVDALLTKPEIYKKCTNKLKASHFFMTQRMLAKGYPRQINVANVNGLDPVAILDAYHAKLCNPSGVKPRWLYAKDIKSSSIVTKEQQLFKDITSNVSDTELLLQILDIEFKSLLSLIEVDFSYVQKEYEDLLKAKKGKISKNKN